MHVFDRTADETISWIQEKDALLMAEDYDNNLETIQALVRKHEGFEADLAAVKEQVCHACVNLGLRCHRAARITTVCLN